MCIFPGGAIGEQLAIAAKGVGNQVDDAACRPPRAA